MDGKNKHKNKHAKCTKPTYIYIAGCPGDEKNILKRTCTQQIVRLPRSDFICKIGTVISVSAL